MLFFSLPSDREWQRDILPRVFGSCLAHSFSLPSYLFSRSYTRAAGLRHVFFILDKKEKGSPRASLSLFSFEAERNGVISFELPHDLRCFTFVRPHHKNTNNGQPSNVGLLFLLLTLNSPHQLMRSQKHTQAGEKDGARMEESMGIEMYFRKTRKLTEYIPAKENTFNEGCWPSCPFMPCFSNLSVFRPLLTSPHTTQ